MTSAVRRIRAAGSDSRRTVRRRWPSVHEKRWTVNTTRTPASWARAWSDRQASLFQPAQPGVATPFASLTSTPRAFASTPNQASVVSCSQVQGVGAAQLPVGQEAVDLGLGEGALARRTGRQRRRGHLRRGVRVAVGRRAGLAARRGRTADGAAGAPRRDGTPAGAGGRRRWSAGRGRGRADGRRGRRGLGGHGRRCGVGVAARASGSAGLAGRRRPAGLPGWRRRPRSDRGTPDGPGEPGAGVTEMQPGEGHGQRSAAGGGRTTGRRAGRSGTRGLSREARRHRTPDGRAPRAAVPCRAPLTRRPAPPRSRAMPAAATGARSDIRAPQAERVEDHADAREGHRAGRQRRVQGDAEERVEDAHRDRDEHHVVGERPEQVLADDADRPARQRRSRRRRGAGRRPRA